MPPPTADAGDESQLSYSAADTPDIWFDAITSSAAAANGPAATPTAIKEAQQTVTPDAADIWFDAYSTSAEYQLTSVTAGERCSTSTVPDVPSLTSTDAAEAAELTSTAAEEFQLTSLISIAASTTKTEDSALWFDAIDSSMPGTTYCYVPSCFRVQGKQCPLPTPCAIGNDPKVGKLLNLTDEQLEPCLQRVLDKGPKFAITQKITKKTFRDVEVGVERAVYALRWKLDIDKRRGNQPYPSHQTQQLKPRFPDNDAAVPPPASSETERTVSKLKRKLLGIYRNHRSTTLNVKPDEEKALKELSQKDDVIVKPSDKCKGFVIMDKGKYVDKALDILADYEPARANPTPKVEATTKRVIKSVMEDKVDKQLVQALLPQGSRTAEMYGLPKNHKQSVPLRPIVSACGDPLDKLCWFLERILNQLLQFVPAHLPNTDAYLNRLKQTYPNGFPPGTTVFSLDVKNLYGNIPIDEAVQTVMNLLQAHKDSINLFGLFWLDVEPLLEHCLTNSYCRFGQSYFKQKLGLPMGSRIAPPIAIIFMGALEDVFLSASHDQPSMYMRYIDDCFCVWPHSPDTLTKYLECLNTVHPTIKFTMERF